MSDATQNDPVQAAYDQLQQGAAAQALPQDPAPLVAPQPPAVQSDPVAPAVVAEVPGVPAAVPQPTAPVATGDPAPQEPTQGVTGAVVAEVKAEGEDLAAHADAAAGLVAQVFEGPSGLLVHIHDRVEYYVQRLEAGLHVPIDDIRTLLARIKDHL